RYVATKPLVRGLVLGILGAFVGGGVVVGTAKFYAISVGGGDAAFSLLFAVLFIGLGLGIVGGPPLVRTLSRRRWFGISIVLAGAATIVLALAPHLSIGAFAALLVGAGAGMAFLAGITLLGTEVEDDVRGRVFAFVNTASRAVLMLAISLSSVIVGFGSSRHIDLAGLGLDISTTRVLLVIAGGVGIATGLSAFRQMDDKPGVSVLGDLWSSIRGRPLGLPEGRVGNGLFVVFEGGEGAGKSTQAVKLAAWLQVHGIEAVLTREPGATSVGARIRSMLLDKDSLPEGETLSPRAEALLYAADRAHHVSTVVRPALARGAVVVSDRYVDSSLAYQGSGRVLPVDEVAWLSQWATGSLKPDLVVLLDVEPGVGSKRVSGRGASDRLESESPAFHERVRYAFLDLAAADPRRYLVLDADSGPEEIARKVTERVTRLLPPLRSRLSGTVEIGSLIPAEGFEATRAGDGPGAAGEDGAVRNDAAAGNGAPGTSGTGGNDGAAGTGTSGAISPDEVDTSEDSDLPGRSRDGGSPAGPAVTATDPANGAAAATAGATPNGADFGPEVAERARTG
ncbi:MAG: dTMP kinase, partial [Micromonosporaceae bacterium]